MARASRSDDKTPCREPAALCESIRILSERVDSRPQANDRPVLLLVGHWGIPTGFRRVLRAWCRRLPPRFDLHLFAINKFEEENAPQGLPVTVHRNRNLEDIHDPAAPEQVVAAVRPR